MTTNEKYERLLAIARAITEDVNCCTALTRNASYVFQKDERRRAVVYEMQGENQPIRYKLEVTMKADDTLDTILDALIEQGLLLVERKKADASAQMALLNAALGDCARVI